MRRDREAQHSKPTVVVVSIGASVSDVSLFFCTQAGGVRAATDSRQGSKEADPKAQQPKGMATTSG